jgi:hypothetical protein
MFITRNEMKTKSKSLQVRVTVEQFEKVGIIAKNEDVSKSEILRGFIDKAISALESSAKSDYMQGREIT